jgi:hypothetical protein
MIRPSFRLPLWAAVAIAAAAYTVRSIARGGDFTPDLPGDAIVYGLLLLVVAAVALARSRAAHESDDDLTGEMRKEDRAAGQQRQNHEVLGEIEGLHTGSTRPTPDDGKPASEGDTDGGADPPGCSPEDATQDGRTDV